MQINTSVAIQVRGKTGTNGFEMGPNRTENKLATQEE